MLISMKKRFQNYYTKTQKFWVNLTP